MKKAMLISALAFALAACGSSSSSTSTSGSTGSNSGTTTGSSAGTTTGSSAGTTTGSSGSSGGSSGSSAQLTGPLAFTVGRSLQVVYIANAADGGLDPNRAEIDATDDATDTCSDDYALPDGGVPAAEHYYLILEARDQNGVQAGQAYNSLTAGQWNNYFADGGGRPSAYALAIDYDATGAVYLGVSGNLTFTENPDSGNPVVSGEVHLGKYTSATSSSPATVTGLGAQDMGVNGIEPACGVGLVE